MPLQPDNAKTKANRARSAQRQKQWLAEGIDRLKAERSREANEMLLPPTSEVTFRAVRVAP